MTGIDTFHYKDLKITKNSSPKQFETPSDLGVNATTDHMVEIDWDDQKGWHTPEIKPYAPLALDPTASCLHYATQVFEGLKAFRSKDGKNVRLIRPLLNLERLITSARRASLPEFDAQELLPILEKYISMEARFIAPGAFIYIRPYMIGTNAGLGVKTPSEAKLGIVLTLMPSLSDKTLKLLCSNPADSVRSWPTGFGNYKLGANYGPSLLMNNKAVSEGYDQVLWLFDEKERLVTEAGASNFAVVWKSKEDPNVVEIVTCTLDTKLILPGINRRSVLEYLGEKKPENGTSFKTVETRYSIDDIEQAAKEGRLLEAFAIGTAYFVAPVSEIKTPEGVRITVPVPHTEEKGIAHELRSHFATLMYGDDEQINSHPWVVKVQE